MDHGASRQAACNPIDKLAEKTATEVRGRYAITHEAFMKIISPSFEGVKNEEDMVACLARQHIICCADTRVFYRLAGEDEVPVPYIK